MNASASKNRQRPPSRPEDESADPVGDGHGDADFAERAPGGPPRSNGERPRPEPARPQPGRSGAAGLPPDEAANARKSMRRRRLSGTLHLRHA